MNYSVFKPKKRNLARKKPSNFELWAKNELELIEKGCEDKDGLEMQKMITKDIMDIVKVFANQGHSGFSASYTLGLLKRLLDHKPILPLTGEDDEWGEVEEWNKDKNKQQNKRCYAVFRDNFDNSTATYLHGKVFSDNGGKTWFEKKESTVPITFPYNVPLEPEYVYVDSDEEMPEDVCVASPEDACEKENVE